MKFSVSIYLNVSEEKNGIDVVIACLKFEENFIKYDEETEKNTRKTNREGKKHTETERKKQCWKMKNRIKIPQKLFALDCKQ